MPMQVYRLSGRINIGLNSFTNQHRTKYNTWHIDS